ncbi:MAG: hypothetical protein SFU98_12635 [Leptospiraceae bacterium]|nr:hypothetical protein [Leptospiraceae bacterium]
MNREKLLSFIFSSLLLIIINSFFIYCCYFLLNQYDNECINKEFLTWDPELRYIITLKLMNFAKEGKVFHILGVFFDSPHWPSLRNLIEMIVFFITKPSPFIDTMLSTIFYPLTLIGVGYILYDLKTSILFASLTITGFILAFLQADSILLYSFTGMLEVQGGFIFLLTVYFLGRFYVDSFHDKEHHWIRKVFIICILLHQTKYPYGYMLVLSIIVFHGLFFFKESFAYVKDYFNQRVRTIYSNPFLILAIVCLIGAFLPASILKGKIPGYFRFAVVLFLTLDLIYHFYKIERNSSNFRIIFILKTIIFPILIWMLLQPDRFGSYAGQITHVESQGGNPGEAVEKNLDYFLLFISEFITTGFREFHLGYLFFVSALVIFCSGLWKFIKEKSFTQSFLWSSLCLLTILELSLFTTNRLSRHIFHLFPALILLPFLFIWESKQNLILKNSLAIFLILAISFPFLLSPLKSLSETEVCYTGYNTNDYKTPKWMESKANILMNTNAYVYNEMSPLHVNKADVEYLFQREAFKKNLKLIFDPKRLKVSDQKFKEIWIVGEKCANSTRLNEASQFWKTEGFSLENPKLVESDIGCIQIYSKE